MAVVVNTTGKNFASRQIREGSVDRTSSWSFSAADGKELLGPNGDDWTNYAKHHLAEDTSANEETKARYKYPFAKNGIVFRSGVIAIKQRAAAQGETDIVNAADDLLKMIDQKGDAGSLQKVQRADYFGPDWMTSKFERTDTGYLAGRAIVTNVGVFYYTDAMTGKTHAELRLPEEVFRESSIDSLKLKPVTNDHPLEKVTASNIKAYQVGTTGSLPSKTTQHDELRFGTKPEELTDGFYLSIDLAVTDESAIADVENGKRSLSCGYTCDLEPAKPGAVWCGIPYDYIQRNIEYNHVALVDRARAGDAARIRMDGVSFQKFVTGGQTMAEPGTQNPSTNIDSIAYQREIDRANTAEKQLADTQTQFSKLQADRDTLSEKLDAAKKELEEAKAALNDQSKIDAAVKARLELLRVADKAKIENADSLSEDELRKVIIKSEFPNANLDDKDQAYISGRLESAIDSIEKKDQVGSGEHQDGFFAGAPTLTRSTENIDSAKARELMIARQKAESRGQEFTGGKVA